MANPGAGTVPREGWALKPAGIGYGDRFRLLFVSSTTSQCDLDGHQRLQPACHRCRRNGHSAIRALKNGFRAIASTEAVDARDNAGLTGTGVKIYWLGSNDKVADNNGDLLDGTWDNETAKNESGQARSASNVWTGSTDGGTERTFGVQSLALGAAGSSAQLGPGRLNSLNGTPLTSVVLSSRTSALPLYALSQELKLPPLAIITTRAPTFVSQPRTGDIYGLGETISFRAEFSEPVSVRGVPTYLLKLDSGDVRARYISGSGTDGLVFAYTVQVDDYDEDGVSIVIPLGDSPSSSMARLSRRWRMAARSISSLIEL